MCCCLEFLFFQVAARDAYLHLVSARPTALLLTDRVIDEARELISKH